MQPLISVIIPAYNGADYIEEAIRAIQAQEMNTEILVIDDASPDNSGEIAAKCGCRVIRNEKNLGQVTGKNVGLRSAQGEFIMFHDQDDIMREGILHQLYDELTSDFDMVTGRVQNFFSPEMTQEQRAKVDFKAEPFWGLLTGAALIRKKVFDIIGFWDESGTLNTGDMIEFASKFKKHGLKQKKIELVTTDRRVHAANFGMTNREKEYMDYAKVLRTKLKGTANV
jgi:glycosyltransferase involved in cell wall biosynthesis